MLSGYAIIMTDKTTHDADQPADERAAKLTEHASKVKNEHAGNRASHDPGSPQPTREPTRDRRH